ncbi:MAG: class I SAM-dependent methyltransferase [Candidatus Eisenbacteria bacterium]|uniref:Class I SAM-dependent methyltransferase n=1 Tax=Eiseniibacteriota bacterium TaxID=2212470 RepID=A0A9D6LA20_UNCEI|nr:class I SAM-dependent methyltransferase [Candidatus Eisenbacteria bacterium]MBI3539770.1 class I SAM-dependent methyltransferase [Candidatus Eisenbacteria bacterium]
MDARDIEGYVQPERYDFIYSWYRDDLEFYVERAKAAGGPVLECGCGTGRILLPTLQTGVDIEGIDIHPGMIEVLQRKAAALGLAPRVQVADMRDFTLPRRFPLVTIPFRAFMHLTTTADQLAALGRIRAHLAQGGVLVYNLWFPSFERIASAGDELEMEREWDDPESGLPVAIYARNHYDRVRQVLKGEREVRVSDARGYVAETLRDRLTLRWTFVPEMELLLQAAGFSRWALSGGFDGAPYTTHAQEMVWTAWA